jgi:hypothetical protein
MFQLLKKRRYWRRREKGIFSHCGSRNDIEPESEADREADRGVFEADSEGDFRSESLARIKAIINGD